MSCQYINISIIKFLVVVSSSFPRYFKRINKLNYVGGTHFPGGMSSDLLYRALYVLVHGLFTVFESLYGALEQFVDFCHEFVFSGKTDFLKFEIEKKNKLPKHLTVLLGNEEPSYKDLANFVVWCLASRILYLSFFDHKGYLKNHRNKLGKEIIKKLQPSDHIIWHDIPGTTYKNGFIGRKIHIKLLSEEDGKENVVKSVKNLTESAIPGDFSIESVDRLLKTIFEFPDPDLGLYCGPNLIFFSYPPWQLRITEFLSIKTHHSISYRKFLKKLYIYSKCEQRLGK